MNPDAMDQVYKTWTKYEPEALFFERWKRGQPTKTINSF